MKLCRETGLDTSLRLTGGDLIKAEWRSTVSKQLSVSLGRDVTSPQKTILIHRCPQMPQQQPLLPWVGEPPPARSSFQTHTLVSFVLPFTPIVNALEAEQLTYKSHLKMSFSLEPHLGHKSGRWNAAGDVPGHLCRRSAGTERAAAAAAIHSERGRGATEPAMQTGTAHPPHALIIAYTAD